MPNNIEIDLVGDASQFAKTVNDSTDDMVKLNEEVEDFGKESKKAFGEGTKAADDFNDEVKNTTKQTEKQSDSVDELKKKLKELETARDKSHDPKKIRQLNKEFEEGEKKVKQLTNAGKEGFDDMGNSIDDTGGRFGNMLDIAGGFGIAFGVEAIISGVIAVGTAVVETVSEFRTLRGEVGTLTGLSNEALDKQVEIAKSIGETFDQDVNEVIKAANVLSNEFGLTQEESLEKVRTAALGVAGDTGELIEQTKEYASQIKAAGGDADDLFNIINKSAKEGVFSDKGIDVVKEFGLRIREQTTTAKDAMDAAFGEGFRKRIFDGINDGSLTSIQALELVSEKMNDSTVPAMELQTVIADVFGGPGEDAGLAYLQTLTDLGGPIEGLIDKTSSLTRNQLASLDAQEKLAKEQNKLSKLFDDTGTGGAFFVNLQALGFEFLSSVIEPVLNLFTDLKESFTPLLDTLGELKVAILGAGEGFSFFDVVLTPFKISLKTIGFLLSFFADGLAWVVEGVTGFIKSSPALLATFEFIGEAIYNVIATFQFLGDLLDSGFDVAKAAAKTAAREIDEEFTQPMLEQVGTLDKVQRDRLKAQIIRDNEEIKSRIRVLQAEGKLTEAEARILVERGKANITVLKAIKEQEKKEAALVLEGENEKAKIRESIRSEDAAAAKKAAEQRLKELEKIEAEFLKALERLAKESDKVILDNLEGPEKFAKIKENQLKEIQLLEDTIKEKGQLLADENGEVFELADTQVEQLENLRREARENELSSIAEFNAKKQLEQIKAGNDALDIQEEFAAMAVEDLERVDTDLSEVDFELFKEEEKLRIQQEFAEKRIALLQKEIDTKLAILMADGSLTQAEQNELDKLRLQKAKLEKSVGEFQSARDELAEQRGKFSLAEFLGLSNEDFAVVKERLSGLTNEIVGQLSNVLDAQAEAQEARIDFLEGEIDSKEKALDRELQLNEQGFASNVEGKRQELQLLEEEKKKAQKAAEETAKKQFILDSAIQASSIITASANILKGFSTIPLVGQILGIAQVGVMVAGFIAARTAALQQVKAGQVSLEKGGSGDSTGMFKGKRHNEGGISFLDQVEVEDEEKWSVWNRNTSKKHGKLIDDFTFGLNNGKNPDELMMDLLSGTGVYMKPNINEKIRGREININNQQILLSADLTSSKMVEVMNSVDKNVEDLLGFEKSKIRIVPTPTGRWEIDDVKKERVFISYTDKNESEK
jgi:hypothetical protein